MKKSLLFTIIAVAVAIVVAVVLIVVLQGKKPEGNATLVGLVKDAKDSREIKNATVRIDSIETKTDNAGSFKFEKLLAGNVSIFVTADGFKPYSYENYQLKDGNNIIDEILLEAETEVSQGKKDDGKIILPPPLPGKVLDKIPEFKKFNDFTNCVITFMLGDKNTGTGSMMLFTYSNGIIKQENPNQIIGIGKGMKMPDLYFTDKKMIVNAGDDQGWLSMDKPAPDIKNGPNSTPDKLPYFYYETIFKTITSKTTTVSFVDKVKIDDIEMNKYYIVNDVDNNLYDGEVYTPTSGKYKDVILYFKGRFLLGGIGDKMELHITNIGNAPKISLPSNIKEIASPSTPQTPTITNPKNP